MSFKIVVKSVEVQNKEGIGRASQKAYSLPMQTVHFTTADESWKFQLMLAKGAAPYPVGDYQIASECFQKDNFGELELSRVRLVPLRSVVTAQPSRVA